MLQMEKDKYSLQHEQSQQLYRQLEILDPNQASPFVSMGSLVNCGHDWYYLAVSLGKMQVEGKTVFVLSPESPLGEVFLTKKQGEQFDFRGKKIEISGLW
jgi:transcription elongation GreA/GreB family factor